MHRIWQAVLAPVDVQDIECPEGAEMLTAARDLGEALCVYFKCDPTRPKSKRRIAVYGPDRPVNENDRYIGTAFFMNGHLVLHVFERLTGATSSPAPASVPPIP